MEGRIKKTAAPHRIWWVKFWKERRVFLNVRSSRFSCACQMLLLYPLLHLSQVKSSEGGKEGMMEACGYLYPLDECRLSIKISFLSQSLNATGLFMAGSVHKPEG